MGKQDAWAGLIESTVYWSTKMDTATAVALGRVAKMIREDRAPAVEHEERGEWQSDPRGFAVQPAPEVDRG